MPNLTSKRLVVSLAMIVLGVGVLVCNYLFPDALGATSIAVWFIGGPLIGAGIFHLFEMAVVGAMIGGLAQVVWLFYALAHVRIQ